MNTFTYLSYNGGVISVEDWYTVPTLIVSTLLRWISDHH